MDADVIVVGGGIVGLATAYRLCQRDADLSLVVAEKEHGVGRHQSGHNSGVLHSGIYYKPGSNKALTCRAGQSAMYAFCETEGIPVERSGKVIVATQPEEFLRLEALHARGLANGVRCSVIGERRLRELEPHAAGLRAIHVPDAGVVDFGAVCRRLAERIRQHGQRVVTKAEVHAIRAESADVRVKTRAGEMRARVVVNCAGLYSDRVAAMTASDVGVRIVPFRGEYYRLRARARSLVRTLIYPVPDPALPFLGVHFTRTIDDEVTVGPNAVPALSREGYRKLDVNPRDLLEMARFTGLHKMAVSQWRVGAGEIWRSLNPWAFLRAARRLLPELRLRDLAPAPGGVRAQAMTPDGELLDDFRFLETPRVVHVLNAPSPAATASLAIGERIAERVLEQL